MTNCEQNIASALCGPPSRPDSWPKTSASACPFGPKLARRNGTSAGTRYFIRPFAQVSATFTADFASAWSWQQEMRPGRVRQAMPPGRVRQARSGCEPRSPRSSAAGRRPGGSGIDSARGLRPDHPRHLARDWPSVPASILPVGCEREPCARTAVADGRSGAAHLCPGAVGSQALQEELGHRFVQPRESPCDPGSVPHLQVRILETRLDDLRVRRLRALGQGLRRLLGDGPADTGLGRVGIALRLDDLDALPSTRLLQLHLELQRLAVETLTRDGELALLTRIVGGLVPAAVNDAGLVHHERE